MMNSNIKFGTCSWNYDSWVGLIYPSKMERAVFYLPYYAEKYETAEIDSWFYRIPDEYDVREYKDAVPDTFRFTCKVPQAITLTHHRKKAGTGELRKNDNFLSIQLFEEFIRTIEPLIDRIDAIMFEFEYLNKQKMGSLNEFIPLFEDFLKHSPGGFPYSVETRNSNYLIQPYFEFVQRNNIIHVFSEKIYMPHIYETYPHIKDYIKNSGSTVIRLLGGDRKTIEKKTNQQWTEIVEPKDDLDQIADMIRELSRNLEVTVNVNNHYEGSAPKTIDRLSLLLK